MGLFVMLGSLRQPEMLAITAWANIVVISGPPPPPPTSLFFLQYNNARADV